MPVQKALSIHWATEAADFPTHEMRIRFEINTRTCFYFCTSKEDALLRESFQCTARTNIDHLINIRGCART